MAVEFKDRGTQDVANRIASKAARKVLPVSLHLVAARKLDLLNYAAALDDLRVPPGNRLKALSGNREGKHSIRINDQYRICFRWTASGPVDVEIVDYH